MESFQIHSLQAPPRNVSSWCCFCVQRSGLLCSSFSSFLQLEHALLSAEFLLIAAQGDRSQSPTRGKPTKAVSSSCLYSALTVCTPRLLWRPADHSCSPQTVSPAPGAQRCGTQATWSVVPPQGFPGRHPLTCLCWANSFLSSLTGLTS